jgi:DNA-binding transcriptional LysR family regulator
MENGGSMKLESLQEYVTLVKHQSFTSAARELYLAQPSLSAHINAMEKELGVPLIDRSNGSFGLTPAGTTFLEYAQQIIRSYAEARERCSMIAAKARPLRIGSSPATSSHRPDLGNALDTPLEFVDFDLETSLFGALTKGVVDIGTIADFSNNPSLSEEAAAKGIAYRSAGKAKAAICVMKSHPLAAKSSLARADLRGCTAVIASGANFDSWKSVIIQMLGEDSGLEFRLNPVKHFGNLVNVDLRDCIHICGLEAMRAWFGHRDDMVIYEKLDGEDMLYLHGFAYLASNTAAAALAERLSQLAAAS